MALLNMHIMRALTLATAIVLPACGSTSPSAPAAPPPAAATSSEVTGVVPKFAIVTLLPDANSAPMPSEAAVMDQISKQFLPHTLIVRVGQPVEFRNSEDMPHNVSVTRRESGSEVFNVSTEPHQKYVHTFERVGQFDVKCDIHEGMEATVIAARGPLTAISGDDGRFSLPNVAFGSYKVSLTFNGQTVEQAITVNSARTEVKLAR
jgi:plastocyanin